MTAFIHCWLCKGSTIYHCWWSLQQILPSQPVSGWISTWTFPAPLHPCLTWRQSPEYVSHFVQLSSRSLVVMPCCLIPLIFVSFSTSSPVQCQFQSNFSSLYFLLCFLHVTSSLLNQRTSFVNGSFLEIEWRDTYLGLMFTEWIHIKFELLFKVEPQRSYRGK